MAFSPFYVGGPGDADFNADAYLAGLEELAGAGVTCVHVSIPGDSVAHAVEAMDRFRQKVIDAI